MYLKGNRKLLISLIIIALLLCIGVISSLPKCKIPIKVLLLPKFELGELTGDSVGEAQEFYEAYLQGADEYDISGDGPDKKLYVKDGIALYVCGIGKVNSSLNITAVLNDERFDFSDTYFISVGCCGGAVETATMGDAFVITTAVDYDLGHHADARDLADQNGNSWFYDAHLSEHAKISLDKNLTEKVFNLVKDIRPETTEITRKYLAVAFDNAEWAIRDPQVLKGTTITADNYWKGIYSHNNALKMIEVYECPDPFVSSEMEDAAIGLALEYHNKLDHYIIIRTCINMDVFMVNATPENLWADPYNIRYSSEDDALETFDIFNTAMKNEFKAVDRVVQAILSGEINQVE